MTARVWPDDTALYRLSLHDLVAILNHSLAYRKTAMICITREVCRSTQLQNAATSSGIHLFGAQA